MRQKKITLVLICCCCVAVLAILLAPKKDEHISYDEDPELPPAYQRVIEDIQNTAKQVPAKSQDVKLPSFEEMFPATHQKEIESKATVNDFKEKTYLEIPDFEDFHFEDHSWDNVAIMAGKNAHGDIMTLIATREVVPTSLINTIILKNQDLFPLNSPDVSKGDFEKVMEFTSPRNGFASTTVFRKDVNGKTFAAIYAPRADGKGSYGIMLEGDADSLMQNYDYYENKLAEFKAKDE